ncbi:ankyrin repeat domain-containing protein [Pseudomonas sp. YQ_5]|uniref:ankyrin repeat domain-containing protein n=1 Tax=Pseudomonas sp. YQ_5 TaxID=3367229 RepID=UPI00370BFEC3
METEFRDALKRKKPREKFYGEASSYNSHGYLTLIECVKYGYPEVVKSRIDQGTQEMNMQDEQGMTALHYAAALGSRHCLRVLVNSGKCDYLLKDNHGRYASELAFSCGADYAVGVLLSKKQVKQAHELGINLEASTSTH